MCALQSCFQDKTRRVSLVQCQHNVDCSQHSGEKCWIKWPYLQEALVQEVSNSERSISRARGAAPHTQDESRGWQQQAGSLARDLLIKEVRICCTAR